MDLRSRKKMEKAAQSTSTQDAGDTDTTQHTNTTPDTNIMERLLAMMTGMEQKIDDSTKRTEENNKKLEQKIDDNSKKIEQKLGNLEHNNKKMERRMEENSKKMEEKFEGTVEEIKLEMNKFETKITRMHEEIGEEINTQVHKARDEIRNELQQDVENLIGDGFTVINKQLAEQDETIKHTLNEQEKRIQQNTQKINALPNITSSTCTHSQIYSSTELYFYGDARVHPKIFMTRLKQYVSTLHNLTNIKFVIQNTLKGEADFWYQTIEEKYESFEQFENLFLKQYWGEYNQQKVRQNLFNGKYYENSGISRERYILRKLYNIRYLEPKFTENEMVRYLARHFSDDIHNVIIIQRINTLDDLIEYLRGIDDYRTGWRKPAPREDRRDRQEDNRQNRENQNYRNYGNQNRYLENRGQNRNYNNENTDRHTYAQVTNTNFKRENTKTSDTQNNMNKIQTAAQLHTPPHNQDF